MNHKRGDEQTPKHAETAAEEVFDEVEDAETRLPGNERDREKDGEAADALTPNPSAQEDVQPGHGNRKHGGEGKR
ncbi:hypothetical protein [Streptomyces sp. NPDC048436]|uniref:hypothetical protein n=1 Tax=Streptomyces sp. NPDC048436 TaxID=3365550 RepID=UPI0037197D66